jgi:hypothetical protein
LILKGKVREHANLDKYLANSNIIYFEPPFGNHFGFYEGPLHQAFSNKTSYTYPAKVALKLFNDVLAHEKELKASISDADIKIGCSQFVPPVICDSASTADQNSSDSNCIIS